MSNQSTQTKPESVSRRSRIILNLSKRVKTNPSGITAVKKLDREEFFAFLWQNFGGTLGGLEGIHEGSVTSEEAHAMGSETEAFVIDPALAPRERDWVSDQDRVTCELYFASMDQAKSARNLIEANFHISEFSDGVEIWGPIEEKEKDWNAEWKSHFKGIEVIPDVWVLPPWESHLTEHSGRKIKHKIIINPGAGFGTGTHETTQLCLKAALLDPSREKEDIRVLDFGSGSGVLGIGLSVLRRDEKRNTLVFGIEIDQLANDNARENAVLNGVNKSTVFFESMEQIPGGPNQVFDVVFANIIRDVLLTVSDRLVSALTPGHSTLILSGLVSADLKQVLDHYVQKIETKFGQKGKVEVFEKNDWVAICFRL